MGTSQSQPPVQSPIVSEVISLDTTEEGDYFEVGITLPNGRLVDAGAFLASATIGEIWRAVRAARTKA